jgi:hypothetical protein
MIMNRGLTIGMIVGDSVELSPGFANVVSEKRIPSIASDPS